MLFTVEAGIAILPNNKIRLTNYIVRRVSTLKRPESVPTYQPLTNENSRFTIASTIDPFTTEIWMLKNVLATRKPLSTSKSAPSFVNTPGTTIFSKRCSLLKNSPFTSDRFFWLDWTRSDVPVADVTAALFFAFACFWRQLTEIAVAVTALPTKTIHGDLLEEDSLLHTAMV